MPQIGFEPAFFGYEWLKAVRGLGHAQYLHILFIYLYVNKQPFLK
jgi:hypothetical protein